MVEDAILIFLGFGFVGALALLFLGLVTIAQKIWRD